MDVTTYYLELIIIEFPELKLAVEIDKKVHTDRDLIFEEKRQEALKKTLDCEFIIIHASKENCDGDYEIGRIQTFITKSTKNENDAKMTLKMKFKHNHETKSKTLEYIVNKKLPLYKKGVALKNKMRQQISTCIIWDSRKSTFLKPIKRIKREK